MSTAANIGSSHHLPACQVAKARGETTAKDGIPRKHGLVAVGRPRYVFDLGLQDDGHDDAINGNCFTKDDGDEVFGGDAGLSYTRAKEGCPGDEDAPASCVVVGMWAGTFVTCSTCVYQIFAAAPPTKQHQGWKDPHRGQCQRMTNSMG